MKAKDLLIKIADLILISDDATADWSSDKNLLNSWYLLCFLVAAFALFKILSPAFAHVLGASSFGTVILRAIRLFLFLSFVISLILITYHYYRFILKKNSRVKLINVVYFYFMSILFFGASYSALYMISPSAFEYINPPIKTSPLIVKNWSGNFQCLIDFILYSAFHSVGVSFYKIQFHSILSSVIGWIQSLYSLSLVALFIASYVNQKTNKV